MDTTYTWAKRNSRSVPVQGCTSSQRATVMLGCNGTGTEKLPPYMVFKGSHNTSGRIFQELRKKEGYPSDLEYAVQPKAWFDEQIMLDWIDKVWKPLMVKRNHRLTYLLIDECPVHLTSRVQEAFVKLNTEVDLIPPGYTALLQVMDVGLNKPFKDHCRKSFELWCKNKQVGDKPHRRDAAKWCKDAWENISPASITKTWRHIGFFSNDEQQEQERIEIQYVGQAGRLVEIRNSYHNRPFDEVGCHHGDGGSHR
jgi:DDE superfamily endonuclease